MRCMMRNKRKLYVCNEYQDNEISKFKKPICILANYQATNSTGDLIALGKDFPMYIRLKVDVNLSHWFNAGDRVYIDKKPSQPFDELCKDADYEVDSDPLVSLNVVEITLKKLSGK